MNTGENIPLQPYRALESMPISSCKETVMDRIDVLLKKESDIYNMWLHQQHRTRAKCSSTDMPSCTVDGNLHGDLRHLTLARHASISLQSKFSADNNSPKVIYDHSKQTDQARYDQHEADLAEQLKTEEIYRLRMSDWSYRIVDFFGASREIVDVAFNYLDRFLALEKFSCDSSFEYKVACITSLSIALKVYNRKTIKTSTLAELSRGEITVKEILEMESMILESLSYNLCPPTCCSFISSFITFLPSRARDKLGQDLFFHASFLSEICVMEISFRKLKQSHVAFAILLTVFDGISNSLLFPSEKREFIQKVEQCLKISSTSEIIITAKQMLRNVYRRSDFFKNAYISAQVAEQNKNKVQRHCTSAFEESRDSLDYEEGRDDGNVGRVSPETTSLRA